ncbi:MAG: S41 family peptidase, partial [Gammaproteobacteria bacterium]
MATTHRAVTDDRVALDKLTSDYIQAMELIRENYVEQPEYDLLTTNALQGMLRVLDPHSSYYDRKSFEEMRLEQRSQYYGIGASVQQRHKGVYIIEPFKDTPAAAAGLRYGDHIVSIDGKNSESWDVSQVQNNLRGELGSEVKVTVRRAGVEQPIAVTIERGAIDLPSISNVYLLRPGVGYVALSRGFH